MENDEKLTVSAGRKYKLKGWPAHVKHAEIFRIGRDDVYQERAFGVICYYDSITGTQETCDGGDWDLAGSFMENEPSGLDLEYDIGDVFIRVQSDEPSLLERAHDVLEALLADTRFRVSIGGNPIAVDELTTSLWDIFSDIDAAIVAERTAA